MSTRSYYEDPRCDNNVGQYGDCGKGFDQLENVKDYAEYAYIAANSAKASADSASASATIATDGATSAAASKEEAIAASNASYEASLDAKDSATLAGESVTIVQNSEKAAKASEDNAKASEDSAKASEESASNFADSAASSAASAKASEDRAAEILEEVENANIDRGAWDPTTDKYPNVPTTNSKWAVSLPDGVLSHVFDGTTWSNGDGLVYILEQAKFQQVKGASGVTSVNTKTGAVVLSATDVGALPLTGGVVNGRIGIKSTSSHLALYETDQDDKTWTVEVSNKAYRVVETGVSVQLSIDEGGDANFSGTLNEKGQRVYSPNNKPAPADIGALSAADLAGGTHSDVLGKITNTDSDGITYIGQNLAFTTVDSKDDMNLVATEVPDVIGNVLDLQSGCYFSNSWESLSYSNQYETTAPFYTKAVYDSTDSSSYHPVWKIRCNDKLYGRSASMGIYSDSGYPRTLQLHIHGGDGTEFLTSWGLTDGSFSNSGRIISSSNTGVSGYGSVTNNFLAQGNDPGIIFRNNHNTKDICMAAWNGEVLGISWPLKGEKADDAPKMYFTQDGSIKTIVDGATTTIAGNSARAKLYLHRKLIPTNTRAFLGTVTLDRAMPDSNIGIYFCYTGCATAELSTATNNYPLRIFVSAKSTTAVDIYGVGSEAGNVEFTGTISVKIEW